jgi:hypothetical protein
MGFEHMIIVFELAKTFRALDRTATVLLQSAEKQIACREAIYVYFCRTRFLLLCLCIVQNSLIIHSIIKRLERRSLSEPWTCGYI